MIHFDLLASIISFSIVLYLYVTKRKAQNPFLSLPLPPGPKKLPILGNMLDLPKSFEWKTYHKWCKELGTDIIHLDIAGTSIVVLDTFEAAWDLLEKRSSIYSSRPRMPMINELMGWDFDFGFMQYGQQWRLHRRLMHQAFHPSAARGFRPHELKAARGLLRRLLDDPKDIVWNLRQLSGETVLSIAYGLDIKSSDDPYIKLAEDGVRPLGAAVPGAFLVDALPILKYVPDWMPGAGFKLKAKEWRRLVRTMVNKPFETTKRNIENGTETSCFMSKSLEKIVQAGSNAFKEEDVKCVAGTMFAAGSDTTVSAIATCILGFLEYPEVLKKAQQEIDSVLKAGALPDFEDEDSLPYLHAIVKEALRWRDVTPIAIPHYIHVDDEYKGYRIPADSIVIPNAWAMLHDESVYPDPFTFNPDRFMKDGKLDKSMRDSNHAAFGFGRRICPGRYMATSAIWITVASLVTAFDITKAVDGDGNTIEPSHEYLSGLISFPVHFECSFKPRSKAMETAIRSTINDEYHH